MFYPKIYNLHFIAIVLIFIAIKTVICIEPMCEGNDIVVKLVDCPEQANKNIYELYESLYNYYTRIYSFYKDYNENLRSLITNVQNQCVRCQNYLEKIAMKYSNCWQEEIRPAEIEKILKSDKKLYRWSVTTAAAATDNWVADLCIKSASISCKNIENNPWKDCILCDSQPCFQCENDIAPGTNKICCHECSLLPGCSKDNIEKCVPPDNCVIVNNYYPSPTSIKQCIQEFIYAKDLCKVKGSYISRFTDNAPDTNPCNIKIEIEALYKYSKYLVDKILPEIIEEIEYLLIDAENSIRGNNVDSDILYNLAEIQRLINMTNRVIINDEIWDTLKFEDRSERFFAFIPIFYNEIYGSSDFYTYSIPTVECNPCDAEIINDYESTESSSSCIAKTGADGICRITGYEKITFSDEDSPEKMFHCDIIFQHLTRLKPGQVFQYGKKCFVYELKQKYSSSSICPPYLCMDSVDKCYKQKKSDKICLEEDKVCCIALSSTAKNQEKHKIVAYDYGWSIDNIPVSEALPDMGVMLYVYLKNIGRSARSGSVEFIITYLKDDNIVRKKQILPFTISPYAIKHIRSPFYIEKDMVDTTLSMNFSIVSEKDILVSRYPKKLRISSKNIYNGFYHYFKSGGQVIKEAYPGDIIYSEIIIPAPLLEQYNIHQLKIGLKTPENTILSDTINEYNINTGLSDGLLTFQSKKFHLLSIPWNKLGLYMEYKTSGKSGNIISPGDTWLILRKKILYVDDIIFFNDRGMKIRDTTENKTVFSLIIFRNNELSPFSGKIHVFVNFEDINSTKTLAEKYTDISFLKFNDTKEESLIFRTPNGEGRIMLNFYLDDSQWELQRSHSVVDRIQVYSEDNYYTNTFTTGIDIHNCRKAVKCEKCNPACQIEFNEKCRVIPHYCICRCRIADIDW